MFFLGDFNVRTSDENDFIEFNESRHSDNNNSSQKTPPNIWKIYESPAKERVWTGSKTDTEMCYLIL